MASTITNLSDSPVLENAPSRRRKQPPAALVAALIALFILIGYVLIGGSHASKSVTLAPGPESPTITITEKAHAGAFGVVGGAQSLGYGMNDKGNWHGTVGTVPLESKPNRVLTLKEAVGANLNFVNYEGEGDGGFGAVSTDPDRMTGAPKTITKDSERLTKLRSWPTIVFGGILNTNADFVNGITGLVFDFTQSILTIAYDPHTVCSDAKDTNCVFNMTKLIAGGDRPGNTGIIGVIFKALYLVVAPLVGLGAIAYAFWNDLKKKQNVKEFVLTIAYTVAAGVLGVALLMNAGTVASLPIKVIQELGGHVMSIGTSAGDEETGADKETGTTSSASAICKSSASELSAAEQTVLSVDSMTCTIWRAVRLDPYARAQFGKPFAKLDVKDPDMAEIIKKAEVDPNTFCVPLKVSGTPADYKNKTLKLEDSNHKVCNLAAYQLYLQTNAQIGDNARTKDHGVEQAWYNLIAVVHADDNMWSTWSYNWSSGVNRFMVTTIAMITFVPIAFILAVFAFISLAQVFLVSILMMVLPIMLMIMIERRKGLSIGKKYFGQLAGGILTYMLYAALLVIGVIIVSAVIDTIDDIALVMIFNMLVGFALWQNRKRLISMIAAANPYDNRHITNKVTNVLARDAIPGSVRANVLGALGGAHVRDAWRNRKTIIDPATDKRAGFLRTVRQNMADGRRLAAENDLLTRKPNSARATMRRAGQRVEAFNAKKMQEQRAAMDAEVMNIRSDRKITSDKVSHGQGNASTVAAMGQAAVADANAAAQHIRRTNENVQRIIIDFEATGRGMGDEAERATFAEMFRTEQAILAANHRRRIAGEIGDSKLYAEASAAFTHLRAHKADLEQELSPEQLAQYGNELEAMFINDPTIGKDKAAINAEFAGAYEQDLKAVRSEVSAARLAEKANKSLDALNQKTLEQEAAEYANQARKEALTTARKNKETAQNAEKIADATYKAALNKFMTEKAGENLVTEFSPMPVEAANSSRLDFMYNSIQRPKLVDPTVQPEPIYDPPFDPHYDNPPIDTDSHVPPFDPTQMPPFDPYYDNPPIDTDSHEPPLSGAQGGESQSGSNPLNKPEPQSFGGGESQASTSGNEDSTSDSEEVTRSLPTPPVTPSLPKTEPVLTVPENFTQGEKIDEPVGGAQSTPLGTPNLDLSPSQGSGESSSDSTESSAGEREHTVSEPIVAAPVPTSKPHLGAEQKHQDRQAEASSVDAFAQPDTTKPDSAKQVETPVAPSDEGSRSNSDSPSEKVTHRGSEPSKSEPTVTPVATSSATQKIPDEPARPPVDKSPSVAPTSSAQAAKSQEEKVAAVVPPVTPASAAQEPVVEPQKAPAKTQTEKMPPKPEPTPKPADKSVMDRGTNSLNTESVTQGKPQSKASAESPLKKNLGNPLGKSDSNEGNTAARPRVFKIPTEKPAPKPASSPLSGPQVEDKIHKKGK